MQLHLIQSSDLKGIGSKNTYFLKNNFKKINVKIRQFKFYDVLLRRDLN